MKIFLTKAASLVMLGMLALSPALALAQTSRLPDPVSRMYDELAKVSSMKANTVINAGIAVDGERVDLVMRIDSVSDTKDKAEVGFTITASSNMPEFREEVGASSVTVKGTLRILSSKKAYLYFSELPELKDAPYDLSKFEGRWIDIAGETDDFVSVSGKSEPFSKTVARLKSALQTYPAFTFTEEGSTGSQYRYRITVNPMYLGAFLDAANGDRVDLKRGDLSEAFEGIKNFRAYLSIDKSSYLPKELTASFSAVEDLGFETLTATVSLTNTYSAFNEKVNLKKPSKAVSLEKLLEDLMGPARDRVAEAAAKSNLYMIQTQAELYYDGNRNTYDGVCSDRTVKSGLKAAGKSNCYAKGQEYAAQTKLKSGYFCVDSTGAAIVTKKSTISSKDMRCN